MLLFVLSINTAYSQHQYKATIKDSASNETLVGVTVFIKGTTIGTVSDINGIAELKNIPTGSQTIVFKMIGYKEESMTYEFPLSNDNSIQIKLSGDGEELEEVIVQSTRTSRTIQNTPTRVEAIELEEIDEKSNMRPSNVSMILHESTGIQVQQTSATSANASIRIQGLDGRYTQLLKDGYANFGNFASGLSILEIPPLDLKQVEIIKGPASTLYGGGAIAGVVNFISKTPGEKFEYGFVANQSHIGQTNLGTFISEKYGKIGFTILGLANFQSAYDVDKDDFTELPQSTDFNVHPKLFIYPNDKTTIILGNSYSKGSRTGGDVNAINKDYSALHTYFEQNNTERNTSTIEFSRQIREKDKFLIKQSVSIFNREIKIPSYTFSGINYNAFSDISYLFHFSKHALIAGGNYIYDSFEEYNSTINLGRDFSTNTGGLYIQDTWDISEKVILESGLRFDNVKYSNPIMANNEFFVLPRISALFKITDKLSSRIGGGMGYKAPTMFTEQTESIQYQNVQPINNVHSENSYGGTADLNFKTQLSDHLYFSMNQMFFFTTITKPLVLQSDSLLNLSFHNASKPVESYGFETNMKFIFKEHLKFFVGYTYNEANAKYLSGNQFMPLLPKNKLNLALVYEKEKQFKIGLEGYFTDQQYLSTGAKTSTFWEFGAMAEKSFGKISLYINAENFTDVRQSKYKRVVNEPHSNPTFDEIWTHTEGFVLSGGIKVKL